jgi:hypothetical protein
MRLFFSIKLGRFKRLALGQNLEIHLFMDRGNSLTLPIKDTKSIFFNQVKIFV